MPSNKNAVSRYKFIDELLSDRHHYYDIHDITEWCNKSLIEMGQPTVSQRCIEMDINYLEYAPFFADIERFRYEGKRCIRYSDPSFSIFTKKLSNYEKNLLCEVLNTVGQFEGLVNFEWLNRFKIGLGLNEQKKIISFSNNPYLKNSNLLGALFEVISNENVILLKYHTFSDSSIRELLLHPYLLKQYNNRWFLLGAANNDKIILTFALDRIDGFEIKPQLKFYECPTNVEEQFEDIVGVTFPKEGKIETIVFWSSENSYNYIQTKPIHGSQKIINNKEEEINYRKKYTLPEEGHLIKLKCIINYELKRELMSYFDEVIVLEPEILRNELSATIKRMNEKYFSLRK